MGGAFVDFDHDGDQDLCVVNFVRTSGIEVDGLEFPEGFPGAANVLYRNNGNGTFTDVSESSRLHGGELRTTALITADFDNSRDVDFFLLNYGDENQLWSNLRDGSFRMVADTVLNGVGGGVGVGAGDLNRDSHIDLALPALDSTRTTVLLNRGNSRYEPADSLEPAGKLDGKSVLNTQFLDFDNDGDLDVLAIAAPFWSPTEAGLRNLYLFESQDDSYLDVTARTGHK